MKLRNFFKAHRYKIIIGTPIIFLLIINSAEILESANRYSINADKSPFVVTGEALNLTLIANSDAPVNALGGNILFPSNLVTIEEVSKDDSVISLWSENPSYSNQDGTLKFSGGITDRIGNLHNANTLSFTLRALKPGKVVLLMQNGMLLANNGQGTNLLSKPEETRLFTLWIRDPGTPSPDINGDGILSIADMNSLYLRTFRAYDQRYDLNRDGKINWSDVKLLSSMMN